MSLSSRQLDAFLEVARTRNFSRAAHNLRLTQPALSQRILNLEEELETVLFIREPSGIRLTERGEALLRYGQMRESMETELMTDWKNPQPQKLGGVLRIGGYSTVMRSVMIPALRRMLSENPAIQVEIKTREIRELPTLLRQGEVDFLLVDSAINKSGWQSHRLGYEENVMVESARGPSAAESYLDHDPEDATTHAFFRLNKLDARGLRRSYLDEIYGILDGVAAGWGRAVVPRHLLKDRPDIRVLDGLRALRVPVVLHYYQQPFYSKLHQECLKCLLENAPDLLS